MDVKEEIEEPVLTWSNVKQFIEEFPVYLQKHKQDIKAWLEHQLITINVQDTYILSTPSMKKFLEQIDTITKKLSTWIASHHFLFSYEYSPRKSSTFGYCLGKIWIQIYLPKEEHLLTFSKNITPEAVLCGIPFSRRLQLLADNLQKSVDNEWKENENIQKLDSLFFFELISELECIKQQDGKDSSCTYHTPKLNELKQFMIENPIFKQAHPIVTSWRQYFLKKLFYRTKQHGVFFRSRKARHVNAIRSSFLSILPKEEASQILEDIPSKKIFGTQIETLHQTLTSMQKSWEIDYVLSPLSKQLLKPSSELETLQRMYRETDQFITHTYESIMKERNLFYV